MAVHVLPLVPLVTLVLLVPVVAGVMVVTVVPMPSSEECEEAREISEMGRVAGGSLELAVSSCSIRLEQWKGQSHSQSGSIKCVVKYVYGYDMHKSIHTGN